MIGAIICYWRKSGGDAEAGMISFRRTSVRRLRQISLWDNVFNMIFVQTKFEVNIYLPRVTCALLFICLYILYSHLYLYKLLLNNKLLSYPSSHINLIDYYKFQYLQDKRATSIGFLGNVVDLWEYLVDEYRRTGDLLVDLASDQTSCHNPYSGGYTPAQLSYHEANKVLTLNFFKWKKIKMINNCFCCGL